MLKVVCASMIILASILNVKAADLIITENGKSKYTIVVEQGSNEQLNSFLLSSAELLQKIILDSSGASLPIMSGDYDGDSPAIFIGKSSRAEKAGIDCESLKGWTHIIKSDNKNVFLVGYDAPRSSHETGRNYRRYYLGSIKSVLEFAKRYCNTFFLLPGSNGIETREQDRIIVPAGLSIERTPQFEYCSGRPKDLFYDLANNFFPSVSYGTYGGHSHDRAIPPEKYGKSHPEYFALFDGERSVRSTRPQYCLSNPDVQELIYQELLNHADQGYDWVQLGQSDGFIPCECETCLNMYGIQSENGGRQGRNEPTWGEKLWIMHRGMAERFLKDRPAKKLVIMSYGPTYVLPKTFQRFPENVVIELCKYLPEDFKRWEAIHVPGGFVTYIYNWGFYQIDGFTPKRTPEFCEQQLKLFAANHVKGIYRCGFGELLGLEGLVYYTYGKFLQDSDADVQKIHEEYCLNAFGEASEPMKRFYALLYQRVGMNLDSVEPDWNDTDLLAGTKEFDHENMKLLLLRYPHQIVNELENDLIQAEKRGQAEKVKTRLELVRIEFDYLKHTARIAETFMQYISKPSLLYLGELNQAIKKRNSFVAALEKYENGVLKPWNGFSLFGGTNEETLLAGGRLGAPLKGPFLWDFDFYLNHGIVPNGRVIKAAASATPIILDGLADDPVWERAEAQYLVRLTMNKNLPMIRTTVKVAYDQEALYVLGTYDHVDPENLRLDWMFVFLGPKQDKTETAMFPGRLSSKTSGYYTCEPHAGPNMTDSYTSQSGIEGGQIRVSGNSETGDYTVEMKIPFQHFNQTPVKGDVWFGNFKRRCAHGDFIWEPNIFYKIWRDRYQSMGQIIFE